ncbi:hypothetical protein MBLNU457_1207t1 [Dothideomycetes sp. NU457]
MAESGTTRHYPYHKNDLGHNNRGGYMSRANYNQAYGMTPGHASHNSMAYLAQGLQGMNVQDPSFASPGRNNNMASVNPQYSGLTVNTGYPGAFWGNGGQMMFPTAQAYASTVGTQSPAMYTPSSAGGYMAQAYSQGHENSPLSQGWTPSQATGEIPTLITPRCDSISSAENDAPGTPSYVSYPGFTNGGVAVVNRSPNGTYTSTPSPLQMMTQYGVAVQQKVPDAEAVAPRLRMLVSQDPAIPTAVPAPSSPLKPLDRALENVRGETNVYIRGLHPETTDEMLVEYGKRFGDIKSSKSIIDHVTKLCKGFGFVRYHNYKDAEDCIRGFHFLGYEVSFARESFYSQLKAIADDDNTNLYVSNLPKEMNEHELLSIFHPRQVQSARILRHKDGSGRGVGFARFQSRDDCEEVIRAFNNKTIEYNDEEHTIQIRYADTQEQKQLKQQTAAARQFRSAEYEYATQAHKIGWPAGRQQYSQADGNEFENYLGTNVGVPIQQQRWAQNAWRQGYQQRSPLATVPYNSNSANIRRNQMSGQSTPVAKSHAATPRKGGVSLKMDKEDAAVSRGENSSPTDSGNEVN